MEGGEVVPTGVHDIEVLGQRLAHGLGERLGPAVFDQAAADLRLDGLAEFVDARLVLVGDESLLEGGEPAAPDRLVAGLFEQPGQHPFEVEVPQRAIEVVGAADRPAGFHACIAVHCLAGHDRRETLVPDQERAVQEGGELLGAHRVACTSSGHPRATGTVAASAGGRLAQLAVGTLFALFARLGQRAVGEVDLEGRLERPPVVRALDQRGGQRVLEGRSVLQGDVVDGLGRVEVLGERDGQSCVTQLGDEAREEVQHGRALSYRR